METAELEQLIEENIGLMTEFKEGCMPTLLNKESWGRVTYNGTGCSAANFYFDKNTGRIEYFGNYADKNCDRSQHEHATFRIINNKHGCEIIGLNYTPEGCPCSYPIERAPISKKALDALRKTVERYNSRKK
jgi:hypothetical protein